MEPTVEGAKQLVDCQQATALCHEDRSWIAKAAYDRSWHPVVTLADLHPLPFRGFQCVSQRRRLPSPDRLDAGARLAAGLAGPRSDLTFARWLWPNTRSCDHREIERDRTPWALEVKICGLNAPAAVEAALAGGASLVGFVFYPRSPRAVTPQEAAQLARPIGPSVLKVGLVVDPDDGTLNEILATAPLDMLQLHGEEPPRRVAEIAHRSGLPVMKAIKVATAEDLLRADDYVPVADRLLFDGKPPPGKKNALPGGNAVAFDWQLLSRPDLGTTRGCCPADWTAEQPGPEAVEISAARSGRRVSSGVEEQARDVKNQRKNRGVSVVRGGDLAARLRLVNQTL